MYPYARWPVTAAALLVVTLVWVGGCGGTVAPPSGGTVYDTWNGLGMGDEDLGEPNEPDDSGGVEASGDDVGSVVAGETEETEETEEWVGTASLQVDARELDFGAAQVALTLGVRNVGSASAAFGVTSDVEWAAWDPAPSELAAGGELALAVTALRAPLSPGDYTGRLMVALGDDAVEVGLRLRVTNAEVSPLLVVSSEVLDFGTESVLRSLELENGGDGVLTFTASSDVAWLEVSPAAGAIESGTLVLNVSAVRGPLDTGSYAATLTIDGGEAGTVAVAVSLAKPVIEPHIVPWMEVNSGTAWEMENSVAALRTWRRVTDLAVISTTPGHAHLFPQFREAVPGMTIIPGLKTSARLGTDDFDSVSGWELIGADVEELVAAAGEPRILIENETALVSYFEGTQEIDFDLLREGLAYLPQGVEVIWYGARMSNEWYRSRSIPMIEAVQEVTTARIVGVSYAHPDWHNEEARAILDGMVELPTIELTWWECAPQTGNCYWRMGQAAQMLASLGDRPDVLVYPTGSLWAELAESFAEELSP